MYPMEPGTPIAAATGHTGFFGTIADKVSSAFSAVADKVTGLFAHKPPGVGAAAGAAHAGAWHVFGLTIPHAVPVVGSIVAGVIALGLIIKKMVSSRKTNNAMEEMPQAAVNYGQNRPEIGRAAVTAGAPETGLTKVVAPVVTPVGAGVAKASQAIG